MSARDFLKARSPLCPAPNHILCCPLVTDSGKHNIVKPKQAVEYIEADVQSIRISAADLRTLETELWEMREE